MKKYKELESEDIGYASIGNKPDLDTNYLLKEWLYSKAMSLSEYARNPHKLSVITPSEEDHETTNKLANDLDDHYNNPFHDPSYVGRKFLAFGRYTVNSKSVNKGLIEAYKYKEPLDLNPSIHNEVSGIDKALSAHIKPAPFDFHVYTGIGGNLNVFQHRNTKSNRMFFPAYTSTTPLPYIADKFSKKSSDKPDFSEILRIHIPKGSEYGTHIGSAGELSHEAEFLLHRGTLLQYTHEPRLVRLEHPQFKEPKLVMVHDARIIRQTRSLKSK